MEIRTNGEKKRERKEYNSRREFGHRLSTQDASERIFNKKRGREMNAPYSSSIYPPLFVQLILLPLISISIVSSLSLFPLVETMFPFVRGEIIIRVAV